MTDHPPDEPINQDDDPDDHPDGPTADDLAAALIDDDPLTPADRLADGFYPERVEDHDPDTALDVSYPDLEAFDADVAAEYMADPDTGTATLVAGLTRVNDAFEGTPVRVCDLPEAVTFYPGGFSPSDHRGCYRAISGEVVKATDVYPRITHAVFECVLCGTYAHVPQPSHHTFDEPHECTNCQRKGPFIIDEDRSTFVDAQKIRLKVPPELADGDETRAKIDAYTESDLAGRVTLGDRVIVSGTVRVLQDYRGSKRLPTFTEYLEAGHIEITETDHEELDITDAERARIHELGAGAEGDPLEVAAESMAPKIYGYDSIKQALVLALVSGGTITYPTGDTDRADLHVLVLGDPGTAKSRMVSRAADVGWRTVTVSATRVTKAGLLAAAEQDDFGDGEWTMKAGAFVRANGGTLCVDEIDDMDSDVRAAMLEPMSTQRFSASIAGEQVTFTTESSVIAAGNPEKGRFDPFEPIPEQFDLEDALLSRFDLVFVVKDEPDKDRDKTIATHMLRGRDAAKRHQLGEELTDEETAIIEPAVGGDLLPKWIAMANQHPNLPFESEAVFEWLRDAYLEIRGLYDYANGDPIPITARKLEGVVRVAEAAAKLEFADAIDMSHARTATEIVGRSMEDIGKNEEGDFDANIHETGTSTAQTSRYDTLMAVARDIQDESSDGTIERGTLIAKTAGTLNVDPSRIERDVENMKDRGVLYEPSNGKLELT